MTSAVGACIGGLLLGAGTACLLTIPPHSFRFSTTFAALRPVLFAGVSWYILHWSSVAFILFGMSTMLAMWASILHYNR